VDGEVAAAAQEERFSRKKHDPRFPSRAIAYCLEEAGIDMAMVDEVVFYDKPYLKFERLLETYYGFAPRGISSFVTSIPVWVNEKLFLKRNIRKGLQALGNFDEKRQRILFPEHHLSHAASAFFPSPFRDSVILTIDGVGEWATASICLGSGSSIRIIKELRFPHSVGLLYSAFTYYLGFKVNSGEYKLMGLAPYGIKDSEQVEQFKSTIKSELATIHEDGSIFLNQSYFRYATGLRMTHNSRWKHLFGVSRRKEDEPIDQVHCNLALAIQQVTEEIVFRMAAHARSFAENESQSEHLCLAGGVALNCVANGQLQSSGLFRQIFVQPAAGDAGGALGAALAAHHIYHQGKRAVRKPDSMQGAYLGPSFSSKEISRVLRKFGAPAEEFDRFERLSESAARMISDGKVVGWFQGRMEFGPRALGNRSILGDARHPEMQKKLNLKVKFRESFRPFAPSVLMEEVDRYFDFRETSPYMLMVAPVNEEQRCPLPEDYETLPFMERLYIRRSELPAVTHVDFSARLQTVHRETNPRFWQLLADFRNITGYGVVINTSFNVRGEPVVCTPEDAYRCFMRTEMDYLVLGDYLLDKNLQPTRDVKEWNQIFEMD
jgi:carbamoyltransferase